MRYPLLLLFPICALSRDIPVADTSAMKAAVTEAKPGDTLVLRSGEWSDTKLIFKGQGTAQAPITLRAESPGKTVFTGASALRIGGEHLVVEGLSFQNPDASAGDTIEFRIDSKLSASHCRLTNCEVIQRNGDAAGGKKESRWIGIYGSDNRMDHCRLQGKSNKGTTAVVWLEKGKKAEHHIDHNYFGPREVLGKNGGEMLRIGDSNSSMQTAGCVVESNYFERCNGELECISNKSCGNVYRGNVFDAVSGTLTLRHGNRCLVEGNIFLGREAKGTGGIRIIGEDHIVRGNYLEGLRGEDARGGITFMLGIQDSVANGYFQVKRATVENNTLVDCEHPLVIGVQGNSDKRAALPPVETVIRQNVFSATAKMAAVDARCALAGIRWDDNFASGKELGMPATAGVKWEIPKIKKPKAMERAEAGPNW